MNRSLLPLCALLLMLTACSTSSPAALGTPTSLFGSMTTAVPTIMSATGEPGALPPTEAQAPAQPPAQQPNTFTVAVIVDRTSQNVTREQAQALIDEASSYLREFSPIGLAMVDFTEGRGTPDGMTASMVGLYLQMHPNAVPNGLVIFSAPDGSPAKLTGGHGYSMVGTSGYRNEFDSPVGGNNQVYVAVVDYSFKYMACGYGGADAASSPVSLAGECRGQTGVACVQNNGYSMCSNAVGNLYTSTPTHAVASMIVHALLHNFAPGGDKDDYATPECNARMGYPAGFFDLQESEYYNGLCPFVYEEFTKGYRP